MLQRVQTCPFYQADTQARSPARSRGPRTWETGGSARGGTPYSPYGILNRRMREYLCLIIGFRKNNLYRFIGTAGMNGVAGRPYLRTWAWENGHDRNETGEKTVRGKE
jgi:hypothetical protein